MTSTLLIEDSAVLGFEQYQQEHDDNFDSTSKFYNKLFQELDKDGDQFLRDLLEGKGDETRLMLTKREMILNEDLPITGIRDPRTQSIINAYTRNKNNIDLLQMSNMNYDREIHKYERNPVTESKIISDGRI